MTEIMSTKQTALTSHRKHLLLLLLLFFFLTFTFVLLHPKMAEAFMRCHIVFCVFVLHYFSSVRVFVSE